nr:hypothetical protein [Sulfurifustis variabilis]
MDLRLDGRNQLGSRRIECAGQLEDGGKGGLPQSAFQKRNKRSVEITVKSQLLLRQVLLLSHIPKNKSERFLDFQRFAPEEVG